MVRHSTSDFGWIQAALIVCGHFASFLGISPKIAQHNPQNHFKII